MPKLAKILVPAILVLMVLISFFSVKKDSAIMDEVAHIPAGYSYLKFQDYRLNPEHPPLLKMLSSAPLLFLDLKFPINHPAWTEEINGQWESGYQFLYHLGNDADQILFWSRLPVIALLILLGIYIWKWARELLDEKWALVTLFLYAFSPTIIAHSHYVTTDLAAACFIFIAFYYFARYLKNPGKKTIIWAGIALGLAQTAKFSAVLLFPCFALLTLIPLLFKKPEGTSWGKQIGKYITHFILISLISTAVILVIYMPTVLRFSAIKQQELINEVVGQETVKDLLLGLSRIPGARGLTQYLLGVVMVFIRVGGGNTNYFLGQVSNQGWYYYFPVCFLLKETISVLILTGLAVLLVLRKMVRNLVKNKFKNCPQRIKNYCLEHITEISMFLFIVVYGVASIQGRLNIGVRHIMIIFPFTYILIIKEFKIRFSESKYKKALTALLLVLLIWIGIGVAITYPSYLAYYNELTGGPKNGYKYITDSNLDWGQDLRRLNEWVEERGITEIKVDYFGGGDPAYYLGDKFVEWHSYWGPTTGFFAVSATYFSESIYRDDAVYEQSYAYLEKTEPEIVIGHSIRVYYIEEE